MSAFGRSQIGLKGPSGEPVVVENTVRHMFRLGEDLSEIYASVRGVCRDDPALDWCALGAGRTLLAPTVFEDVVKTN
jgi:hypothetical protein